MVSENAAAAETAASMRLGNENPDFRHDGYQSLEAAFELFDRAMEIE